MSKYKYIEIVQKIVLFLHNKDYVGVLKEDYLKRVSPEGLKQAIEEYGGNVTIPPEYSYEKMDVYQVTGKKEVRIDFNLWIDGIESDLTLIVSIVNTDSSNPMYCIDDLRIL